LANNDLTDLLLLLVQLHLLEVDIVSEVSHHQNNSLFAVNPDLRLAYADHTTLGWLSSILFTFKVVFLFHIVQNTLFVLSKSAQYLCQSQNGRTEIASF